MADQKTAPRTRLFGWWSYALTAGSFAFAAGRALADGAQSHAFVVMVALGFLLVVVVIVGRPAPRAIDSAVAQQVADKLNALAAALDAESRIRAEATERRQPTDLPTPAPQDQKD